MHFASKLEIVIFAGADCACDLELRVGMLAAKASNVVHEFWVSVLQLRVLLQEDLKGLMTVG